jgi:hypothetical protein
MHTAAMPTSSGVPPTLSSFERIGSEVGAVYRARGSALDLVLGRLVGIPVGAHGLAVNAHGVALVGLAGFAGSTGNAFLLADRPRSALDDSGGGGGRSAGPTGADGPSWPKEGEPGYFSDKDREKRTLRWHEANLSNLENGRSYLYDTPGKRRDFYRWLYEYLTARGFQLMWPLNAYMVASSAAALLNTDLLFSHNLEEPFLNANQVIFDDMFPKFMKIAKGPVLRGEDAFRADVALVVEEQNLVEPIYAGMSANQREALQHIAAGTGVQGKLAAIADLTADVGYKGGAFNSRFRRSTGGFLM